MKPVIYTTPTCMYCHALMEWLDQQGIEYTQKDLTNPVVADSIERELGYPVTTVPTTVIGDKVIVGFDRPKIQHALQNAKN